jgi:hypothetical protein
MKEMQARAGILLIGAVLCIAAGCKKAAEAPKPVAVVEPAAGQTGMPATGREAIAPAANAQITEEQVRSSVTSHRVPRAAQATDVAIVSISFLTSEQVRNLLHTAKLGVPDQEPMCLVVLSGKFEFLGPPGQMQTYSIAIEVFDAKTGNLMQTGGLLHPPQTVPR